MKDFINLPTVAFVFIILFILWLVYYSIDQQTKFNNWTAQCIKDGGLPVLTQTYFPSEQYECFKEGRIINHVN